MAHDDSAVPDSSEIASCVRSEQALVDAIGSMSDTDPAAPSRLPDWTIGHVLTHVARNAERIRSLLSGEPQDRQGGDARDAEIEAGAHRPWSELIGDVTAQSHEVAAAISARTDWSGTVKMKSGERPVAQLPLLRQREVEVHRVDLGLGYEFSDMPTDYVRRDLRLMEMLWAARKPMGMTELPAPALALDPPTRLAWLMGRVDVPGLEPAGLF